MVFLKTSHSARLWANTFGKPVRCAHRKLTAKRANPPSMHMNNFTKEELEEALRAITSTIGKCEKVQPKLKPDTSQHTLLVRKIKAFHIASSLIMRELEKLA